MRGKGTPGLLPHPATVAQGKGLPPHSATVLIAVNDYRGMEDKADILWARTSKAPSTAVQRFKAVSDDGRWRWSENGTILVENYTQHIFATRDKIKESSEQLEKSGSYVRLRAGDACPYEGCDYLFRVIPTWVDGNVKIGKHNDARKFQALNEAAAKKQRKPRPNKYFLWADCMKAAQAIMGVMDAYNKTARVKVGGKIGLLEQIPSPINEPSEVGNKFGNALYCAALPRFLRAKNDLLAREAVEINRKERYIQLRRQYAALSNILRNEFDHTYGINRYAAPSVGEAYLTAMERDMGGKPGRWLFHWGGVIMQDGRDRITLEGFSVGEGGAQTISSDDWTVNMYGSAGSGQTFHEAQIASGHHGPKATTMVILSAPPKDGVSRERGSEKRGEAEEPDEPEAPQVIEGRHVRNVDGVGMNCLINAIVTAVRRDPALYVDAARQFLVDAGIADYNEMLELAGDSGQMLIAYLRSVNVIDADRGVRVHYHQAGQLVHADVFDCGDNPINIYLSFAQAHFYAVLDNAVLDNA